MIKVEALSIEEALTIAARELGCSVADVDYEITQHPSSGFFGFGKKRAQIVATIDMGSSRTDCDARLTLGATSQKKSVDFRADSYTKKEHTHKESSFKKEDSYAFTHCDEPFKNPDKNLALGAKGRGFQNDSHKGAKPTQASEASAIDSFFGQRDSEIERIALEVEFEINELFSRLPFKIEPIRVRAYDDSTLFVEFRGEDSALLIGKEGYRYKAISYLLFNWINSRYGLMLRLEIAEFLQNQEEMVRNYLVGVIEGIKSSGRGQTRVLDGVLAHIALKQLREAFPDKYVSFRTNSENERYVIVNDFGR